MKRLVHASSSARLQELAAEFLTRQRGPVLVLAPARAAADDLVRQSCAVGSGSLGVQRLTLTQLAASLAAQRLSALGQKPASRLAIEALTARVIAAAHLEHEIPYFAPVASAPGLAPAVSATLTELRLARVDPDALAASGAPGRDLATLLTASEEERAKESLADLPVVFELAIEALSTREFSHDSVGIPLILLDVPIRNHARKELLEQLIARSPAVLALLLTGDETGIGTMRLLLAVTPEAQPSHSPLAPVAASLFAPLTAPTPGSAAIEFFSAAGEGLECVEIARRLRKLAAGDIPFDSAAILLRNPERYQPLLEEALRRAGIPAWFSRGVARPDPAGRAFLALLACAKEKCSATRFAEYLSLGQVPLPGDDRPETASLAPDDELLASLFGSSSVNGAAVAIEPESATFIAAPIQWERIIVDAAVVGGRHRWERRLKGLENEYRFKLAELRRENSPEAEFVVRRMERLRELEKFALPLITALDSLPATATWGEWLDHLTDLARVALKRPESVWSVLDELRAMESIGPVDLGGVYSALSERLRFLRRESGQSRYGRVFVGSIEEARGRSFETVFLPGLAEGLFPRRPLEDPILLDESRALISTGLLTQDDRVADERMLLRLAVGAARQRLIYSYPRMDVMQNRPRVPSFYALELLRAARGKLPDLRLFEREAAEAAPTRLDWPAPRNPIDAIDDAEFDLSMLGHIIQLPPAEAKGSAHYLIGANSHLVRALRNRGRKWRSRWFSVDGLVDPQPETLERLKTYRLAEKAYSPSSLQLYSDCPYKFFLHAMWRLEPREEPVPLDQMDPLTRGSLFHDVQRALLEELKAREWLPVTQERLPEALVVLDAALDREAARYADELAPAIDRVWANEVEELRTDLRGWLQDVVLHSAGWLPLHFEMEFQDTAILERFQVRGKIDLVERNIATGVLRITDHKTGAFPERPAVHVGGGKILQPVLYSLATRTELNAQVASGRLYFCTRKGK